MTLRDVNFFYNQLAISYSAGISLLAFFETLLEAEKNESQRTKIRSILAGLKQGRSLADSLKPVAFVPLSDGPLIRAAEKSGKLSDIFKKLERKYDLAATAEKEVKQKLYLPGLLFIAATFVPSFPQLFLGSITVTQYFINIGRTMGIMLAALFLLNYFFQQSYFDRKVAQTWHLIFMRLPFFDKLMNKIALENFCSSFALLLDAGYTAYDALNIAGETSVERRIHVASRRMVAELKSGKTLARVFEMESIFTADVVRSVRLGHEAGELPSYLQQSAKRLQQDIDSSVATICVLLPTVAHWALMLYVAYSLISMHLGNMSQLLKAI